MDKISAPDQLHSPFVGFLHDLFATLCFWLFFTLGFVFLYSPRYLFFYLFSRSAESHFQRLTHIFYRRFFQLVRLLSPGQQFHIDARVLEISGAVIVCNHLSYLDPLLFISLFKQHKTVVKPRFFKIPIFGWLIRCAGYIPIAATHEDAGLMVAQMEKLPDFFTRGGNLFIFPEATRTPSNVHHRLKPGALKIARLCSTPVYVLRLEGTDRLFPPGRFLFTPRRQNVISLRMIGSISSDTIQSSTLSQLQEKLQQLFFSRPSPEAVSIILPEKGL